MRLKTFTHFIIDEFPTEKNFVPICILTRPTTELPNIYKWKKTLKILTSDVIAAILREHDDLIPPSIIQSCNETTEIEIHQKKFRIDFISTGSVSANFMVLLTDLDQPKEKTFYTGCFTKYLAVLRNPIFLSCCAKNEITDLYVDNTLAGIDHANSLRKACKDIKFIFDKYSNYNIRLDIVTIYGLEDLLMELKINYGIHITIDSGAPLCFPRKGRQLTLHEPTHSKQNLYDMAYYKNLFCPPKTTIGSKTVVIKLIATHYEKKIEKSNRSPIYISYSPHPNPSDLYTLSYLIQPKRVYPIVEEALESSTLRNDILPRNVFIMRDNIENSILKNVEAASNVLRQISNSYWNSAGDFEKEDEEVARNVVKSKNSKHSLTKNRSFLSSSTSTSNVSDLCQEYQANDNKGSCINLTTSDDCNDHSGTQKSYTKRKGNDERVVSSPKRKVPVKKSPTISNKNCPTVVYDSGSTSDCSTQQSKKIQKLNNNRAVTIGRKKPSATKRKSNRLESQLEQNKK